MNTAYTILGPVVTEKAMMLAEHGKYVLFIHSDASKEDVKRAVKEFYGAEVTGVQIIKMPSKMRMRGRMGPQIKRKPRKKAIITLKDGASLDLLKVK